MAPQRSVRRLRSKLQLEHDELGRLKRCEADEQVHVARVDVGLRALGRLAEALQVEPSEIFKA